MRIISASLQNFASYKSLNFNYTDQGLTLINGPNGSGKSTFMDGVCWVLFGMTAKGGTVSEVLSWPGTEVTSGAVHLEIGDKVFVVKRTRGPKATHNDLYYFEVGEANQTRGKDLVDTQKILNNVLGMDAALYLAGAYYHEFSQTAQFFTTTAKNRRAICEQLVDLALPIKLTDKLSENKKQVKLASEQIEADINKHSYSIVSLKHRQKTENEKATNWEFTNKTKVYSLMKSADDFEASKAKAIETYLIAEEAFLKKQAADPVCSECGQKVDKKHEPHNPFTAKIEEAVNRVNYYLPQVEAAKNEVNPYADGVKDYSRDILAEQKIVDSLNESLISLSERLGDLEVLQEVAAKLRGVTISNAIQDIEGNTNKLLTDYFDGEIRVQFEVESNDKLDVLIFKDGNTCVFSQLSKGQRQMLKLTFGIAVMQAVANHHGINFSQLFFDEAMDGFSEESKAKAFHMLEALALKYESIFVVEHSSELKSRFLNAYNVQLVNGNSVIEKS